MIDLRHVRKSFGSASATVRAVDDLSLSVQAGQCVGLLGPNGAGKTTTIRMITGFTPPSGGTIEVGGHDTVRESVAARRMIGYLPEATPLYTEMRVRDFVGYRARLYGLGGKGLKTAVDKAIELCRVSDVARRRIGQLSKGYKQRVGLAAALVHNPPVLILDEPTSGLDPSQIRETRSLIKDLAANRTVLVSSHILPEIEKTCDRVLIIARGRLRADGSPRELTERAAAGMSYVVEAAVPTDKREQAARELRGIAGVGDVAAVQDAETDGRWARWAVRTHSGSADAREEIMGVMSRNGWSIRELSRQLPTLEQVFMQVIESDSVQSGTDGEGA